MDAIYLSMQSVQSHSYSSFLPINYTLHKCFSRMAHFKICGYTGALNGSPMKALLSKGKRGRPRKTKVYKISLLQYNTSPNFCIDQNFVVHKMTTGGNTKFWAR